MLIFCVITLIVLSISLLLYSIIIDDSFLGGACIICPLLLFMAVGIYTLNIDVYTIEPTPTALDVYRGNTELKITSVNGIPTDTVVVFKKK